MAERGDSPGEGRLQRHEITVEYLRPADATRDLAVGTAMTIRDAYAGRFPHTALESIANSEEADVTNPEHVDATLRHLLRGPEEGRYWALATHRHMGYVAVVGAALCIVREGEIFLAEIHTHPDAQRLGVATKLALCAIGAAAQHPACAESGDGTMVMLNVARENPADPTEHPAKLYRDWGFVKTGPGNNVHIGDRDLPTDRMRVPVGQLLPELHRRDQRHQASSTA